jgi:hypothetical protein
MLTATTRISLAALIVFFAADASAQEVTIKTARVAAP